jgi:hypothetical protein
VLLGIPTHAGADSNNVGAGGKRAPLVVQQMAAFGSVQSLLTWQLFGQLVVQMPSQQIALAPLPAQSDDVEHDLGQG